MKKIRIVFMIICIVVLCVAGVKIYTYLSQLHQDHQVVEELQQYQKDGKLIKLKKKNSQMVGWLKIKNTVINYPVMQNKKDPEFYLYRNFKKQYSISGCLFADARCDIANGNNIIIYGHHMRDGSMFHDLDKFAEKSYWKKHKTIHFTRVTLNTTEKRKYKIVGAFYATAYDEYINYANPTTPEEFEEYVKLVKDKSEYETNEYPLWGDKLITLSTCNYQRYSNAGRIVIVGYLEENMD